jgi:hypothetical protein
MIGSFKDKVKDHFHQRALRSALAEKRFIASLLQEKLIMNAAMDVHFANLPAKTKSFHREQRTLGSFDLRVLTDFSGTRSNVIVRVNQNGQFLGAYIADTRTGTYNAILPDGVRVKKAVKSLFDALLMINTLDEASRA